MTPEPNPTWCSSRSPRSPKKNRNEGSLAWGLRAAAFCAEMLTTAGMATLAAWVKVAPTALEGGASTTENDEASPRPCSH